jgi:hypothetical protein
LIKVLTILALTLISDISHSINTANTVLYIRSITCLAINMTLETLR